ncbi:DUF3526 domain-containing protein [uncultured Arcticibacterium sp.]|uniref:ABC transporter permease n=1 Tax=uncultured Arcticibacterium sp. TaxID=2173042 RepID=UPI0030F7513D
MRINIVKILSKQVWDEILKKSKTTKVLVSVMFGLLMFSLISGVNSYSFQKETVEHYSHEVREKWENNPDKHPHRMAHYGYVALRHKYPLSFFDFGMESFIGNAIFLEAHKQNTTNFSEASLSSSLLRFGEISAAMVLQLLLPLLLFFWGFSLVAKERENGTLKMLSIQGITWPEIIIGKSFGLLKMALIVFLPAYVLGLLIIAFSELADVKTDALIRYFLIGLAYTAYYLICAMLAVLVSAKSATAKSSLTKLIGIWLIFTLVLPKMALILGQYLYPSPSKMVFDMAVESEIIEQGDSHNPNDPHYAALKDSLLNAYNVSTVKELPFNYSGFMMKEGEKLSAVTHARHQSDLLDIYKDQQDIVRYTALLNPYLAIKNLSMALAGTDFITYTSFQNQAEEYRYNLAQKMNDLQIELISNDVTSSSDKSAIISNNHWKEFPDFHYQFSDLKEAISAEIISIVSILLWLCALGFYVQNFTSKFKVI